MGADERQAQAAAAQTLHDLLGVVAEPKQQAQVGALHWLGGLSWEAWHGDAALAHPSTHAPECAALLKMSVAA